MNKKIISVLAACSLIISMTSCGTKPENESSDGEVTTAVTEPAETAAAPEETEAEAPVEPDYPVITPDANAITFNDSDDLFTAHCMAQMNFENDEADCNLSVAEYKGEKMLKIEVLGYDDEKHMYKVPKIVFDMDRLVGADNLSRVKSFSCDITQVAAGEFEGDDGEMLFVPGNLMGTFGSNVGEDSTWYQPTGSSNEYAQAEWTFEWEYLHVEGKWLIKGFADGNEESTLVFMRWGIPNKADIYLDNITFYDEDGNSVPIVYVPGEEAEDTSPEETDEQEESPAENTAEETAAE